MYRSMKILINRHFYKDKETVRKKLDVFHRANRLTDAEHAELTKLVETVYAADAADSAEAVAE